jgi:hypothetical protein
MMLWVGLCPWPSARVLSESEMFRELATIPETSLTSSSSSSGQFAITCRRLLAGSSASFRSIISFGFSLPEVPSEV